MTTVRELYHMKELLEAGRDEDTISKEIHVSYSVIDHAREISWDRLDKLLKQEGEREI